MKIDEYGCLVMEHSSPEGNLGDSAAESGRLEHNLALLELPSKCNLLNFRTPDGYVRHPNSIWRENDFSSDQALPLYLAFRINTNLESLAVEMKNRIHNSKWKTGNGTFVNPGFYGILKGNQWLINQSLAVQAWIFRIPWRWDDGKKGIWKFARSEGSSADYLNWIHASIYAYPWVRNMIPAKTLKEKIRNYYSIEPNSQWIIDIYDRVIERYFV